MNDLQKTALATAIKCANAARECVSTIEYRSSVHVDNALTEETRQRVNDEARTAVRELDDALKWLAPLLKSL